MASSQLDDIPLTEEEKELQHEYEVGFTPSCYLERYTGVDNSFNLFSFRSLHHVFSSDLAKGNSLLEVGCGPTIQAIISASRYFEHIVTSDFLEVNRGTVLKWLNNEPDAHDWSPVFKIIAALENEEDYHKLEERVRENVKEVIHCDILKWNPIAPIERHFDVIVTSFCFESATTDLLSYKKSVRNVLNLLNPGGTIVIVGELNGSFYYVGTKWFPAPVITKDVVYDTLLAADMKVVYWSDDPVQKTEHYDCDGMFVLVAKNDVFFVANTISHKSPFF